jgi:pyrophosphatase PpaX
VTLEKLGASPEEAVMLGDSRFDILCARNAGVRSILVDWSVMPEEERQAVRADFLAKTPEEILKWITDR